MKLNIGCGRRKRKDYINIDINKKFHPNISTDVTKGLPFEDNSIQQILVIHFLEHLFYIQVEPFLNECYRVLKHEGVIEIEVPDIIKAAKDIIERKHDIQACLRRIYGGNAIKNFHIPGMHKWAWTEKTLKELLEKLKFEVTKISGGKYHNLKLDTFIEARKR